MQCMRCIEFNKDEFKTYPVSVRKQKRGVPYSLECDNICTFDIEVSSGWLTPDGTIIGYEPGHSDKYWNDMIPVALPYKWQFSFDDAIIHGRRIEDFLEVLEKLPKNIHIIIWIHNLSYEFQFLNNILAPWASTFARNPHKPITAVSQRFPNIEFRCSYMLTRLSLDSWGKSLGCEKLHSLNYDIIRTPLSVLSDEEMDYCTRDCEVLYIGIQDLLKTYKHIERIPITQTGRVRREVKSRVKKNKKTQELMIKLLPQNAYMYSIMKKCFCGGYTHANYTLSGRNVGPGNQYDFASSYPFVMCSEKFPMTPWVEDIFEEDKIDKFAYMIKVRMVNVTPKTKNHYISYSKTEKILKPVTDNGRLISAEEIVMWMTEVDYQIIVDTYNIEEIQIEECYRSKKAYLPKVFIDYLLELYANKTTLKGVEGFEDLYAQSKQYINSIFGMSVTDIIQDEVSFDGSTWSVEYKTLNDINEALEDLRLHNKGRTFIAYQWGPWITAYARKNLWDCIIPNDDAVIYCDTDSIKMRGDADFSWYNRRVDEKLRAMCEVYKIDFELTRPKTPKGVPKPLGYFAKEEPFTEFKTLGAKRYIYREEEDGQLHLTISGVNKSAVACLRDNIDNFVDGFVFDKDSIIDGEKIVDENGDGVVKKKYHTYLDSMPSVTWNKGQEDEYTSSLRFGINMRPTGYKMGVTDEYMELIDLTDIADDFSTDLQGRLSCV